jgi:hypothetical protein
MFLQILNPQVPSVIPNCFQKCFSYICSLTSSHLSIKISSSYFSIIFAVSEFPKFALFFIVNPKFSIVFPKFSPVSPGFPRLRPGRHRQGVGPQRRTQLRATRGSVQGQFQGAGTEEDLAGWAYLMVYSMDWFVGENFSRKP